MSTVIRFFRTSFICIACSLFMTNLAYAGSSKSSKSVVVPSKDDKGKAEAKGTDSNDDGKDKKITLCHKNGKF